MSLEAAPRPQKKSPEQGGWHAGEYEHPTEEMRKHHAEEVAHLEEEIHQLESRLHEVAEMPFLKKVGALVSGLPKSGTLENLYKQLRRLKADPRFTKEEGSVH